MATEQDSARLDLRPEKKTEILLKLLEAGREETRHWHNIIINASFWFNAGILALVAFVIEKKCSTGLTILTSIGVVGLAVFYILFARMIKEAIERVSKEVVRLQNALELAEKGSYVEGTSIYAADPEEKGLEQRYIVKAIWLNVAISAAALIAMAIKCVVPPP
jgi:hypothetical protein